MVSLQPLAHPQSGLSTDKGPESRLFLDLGKGGLFDLTRQDPDHRRCELAAFDKQLEEAPR